jgi:type I restriction enzyme S subunit
MSSEWALLSLSDIADINPRRQIEKGTTTPFIDMAAIPTHARDIEGAIGTRKYKGGGSKFKNGDTLVARITPCLENGKTALVNCLPNDAIGHGSTEFIVLGARSNNDANFIYYLARSAAFRDYAIARMEGTSGRQRVPNAAVVNYTFNCPPAKERYAIGDFLSSIDDRITLLRETNKTLESIAQAIFKSWFVDFDPVRAKMEGRQPEGMDEATAALFPDSFEESELGLIPRGWQLKTLGDVVATLGGATPSTKTEAFWTPEEFHWTTPKDLSGAVSPVLLNTERRISAAGLEKISSGLLPVGTLLMSSRAPIGYLTISRIPVAINQGYIAMPPGRKLPPLFMYFWCKMNMDTIKGHANGSTFMEISKKAFRPIPIVVPSPGILDVFTQIAESLFNKISINTEQADTLSSLRDTLLPRLISGQLRLPESDIFVGQTTA